MSYLKNQQNMAHNLHAVEAYCQQYGVVWFYKDAQA
jgi:hypothetical protein